MDTLTANPETQAAELDQPGLGSIIGLLSMLVFAAYATFIATAMALSPDLVPFVPLWVMLGVVGAICGSTFLYACRLGRRTT